MHFIMLSASPLNAKQHNNADPTNYPPHYNDTHETPALSSLHNLLDQAFAESPKRTGASNNAVKFAGVKTALSAKVVQT